MMARYFVGIRKGKGDDRMAKVAVVAKDGPRPGGAYSQAIVTGNLVFTAGVGPHNPATGKLEVDTIELQTEQTIKNLSAILKAAGSDLSRVVKATVHLANVQRDFAGFNAAYGRLMPDPKPARTTVGSMLVNILVEIDFVAERG